MGTLRKLLCASWGILTALVLAEAALRVGAAVLRPRVPGAADSGAYRILCLGESTTARTFGVDVSWPRQLQDLLDRRGEGRFQVINRGEAAIDTGVILAAVPTMLELYRPHAAIAMMGFRDNSWVATLSPDDSWSGVLRRLARRSRLYRLLRFVCEARVGQAAGRQRVAEQRPESTEWMQRIPSERCRSLFLALPPDRRGVQGAIECCKASLREHPDDPYTLLAIGQMYSRRTQLFNEEMSAEGVGFSLRAVERGVMDPGTICTIGDFYVRRQQWAEAADWFSRGVAYRPEAGWFIKLAEAYNHLGRQAEATTAFQRAVEIVSGGGRIEGTFHCDTAAESLTQSNYNRLYAELKAGGVRLVAMQYPTLAPASLRAMLAGKDDILFVENRENFRRALAQGRYEEIFMDRFAGTWGHCTSAGNRLIAEAVFEKLVAAGLVRSRPESAGERGP